MRNVAMLMARYSIATMVGFGALLSSGEVPRSTHHSFVSTVDARIGRPLTPMSYAGVARRTTRRAVAYGAVATGAVVGGAAMYGAAMYGCRQVVDSYGQIVRVCR